jgi:hypothetical protein
MYWKKQYQLSRPLVNNNFKRTFFFLFCVCFTFINNNNLLNFKLLFYYPTILSNQIVWINYIFNFSFSFNFNFNFSGQERFVDHTRQARSRYLLYPWSAGRCTKTSHLRYCSQPEDEGVCLSASPWTILENWRQTESDSGWCRNCIHSRRPIPSKSCSSQKPKQKALYISVGTVN